MLPPEIIDNLKTTSESLIFDRSTNQISNGLQDRLTQLKHDYSMCVLGSLSETSKIFWETNKNRIHGSKVEFKYDAFIKLSFCSHWK